MTVETSFNAGTLRVYLSGEIDHHAAQKIMSAIGSAIDVRLPTLCVLDFENVAFMDSSGIAIVLRTQKRMKELDGTLQLERLKNQPLKLLKTAKIDKMIPLMA